MDASTDNGADTMRPGDLLSGYRVESTDPLPHIGARCIRLRHEATGARHVHVASGDEENAFSVAFKTVPKDSTGVAHILEHTVLCGSRRYPVRDPFFSMLKRSLSSFMNAFTASDWTMYPFCTPNRSDFYNLLDVYLDAAFFPRLDRLSFHQEGHRLEFEPGPDGVERLVTRGVVYNEMKGAMSSPDQLLGRSLLAAVYPDTPYRHNSGGDPAVIPRLTHADLKAFHATHYHPSNAFFYTYGNLGLEEHLAVISDRVLSRFERIDPGTDVPSQPRWQAPRRTEVPYPIAQEEPAEKKSQVCISWLAPDITRTEEVLGMVLLEQILIGNAASPLRKALIDSGIGSALCDAAGYDGDNRDTLFSCGLKNVDPEDADRIEALVFDTLEGLAASGIDPELIDSAFHQVEFHRKEITNAPYPYGLKLLLSMASTWFHGGDPMAILDMDPTIETLRRAAGKGYFEDLIRRRLLENPHRLRLLLYPDPDLAGRTAAAERERLDREATVLSTEEAAAIRSDARELAALQETDEDVSVLPTLALSDIPPAVIRTLPSPELSRDGSACFEAATNGVFYLSGAFELDAAARNGLAMVPFFCHAFSRSGTARRDYAALARAMDRYTGNLGLSSQARTRYDRPDVALPILALNAKCLSRNQERLFDLVEELFFEADFANRERLRQLLLEYRAAMETMVVQGGHRFAMSLAAGKLTPTARINEAWHGIHQLRFLKEISGDLTDPALENLASRLDAMRRGLTPSGEEPLSAIGDAEDLARAVERTEGLRGRLPGGPGRRTAPPGEDAALPSREAWTTSTAVSFVAQSFRVPTYTHEDAPALAVISKMMRSLYLHREIREKGGAYGGFAAYNPEDGLFTFGSYRDPHIVRTLEVYAGAEAFIGEGSLGADDVKEAVLQVCSDMDKPDPPGPRARKAYFRRMVGLDDDMRERFKTRLLGLTVPDVREAARRHFRDVGRRSAVAVVTSKAQLEAANRELGAEALEAHEI